VLQGANTTFNFLLLFFSCLSLELEVCTTSPLSLVYPKEHSPHQTEMTHFLNTVLMQNAEWPLKGWVRAYAWVCRYYAYRTKRSMSHGNLCAVTVLPM
jgi:hypothetical protein